jgi:hypothetical protein
MPEPETLPRRRCKRRSCYTLHRVCAACDKLITFHAGMQSELCWCVRVGRERA